MARIPDATDPEDDADERRAYSSPVCYANEFDAALAARAASAASNSLA